MIVNDLKFCVIGLWFYTLFFTN